jgi:hypothetical protein
MASAMEISPARQAPRKRKFQEDRGSERLEFYMLGAALLESDEKSEAGGEPSAPSDPFGDCRVCERHNLRLYACTTCNDSICCACVIWHTCSGRWLPCCYNCLMCSLCSAEHDMANRVAVLRAWRREERTCGACHVTQPAIDAHKGGFRLCESCQTLFCGAHYTFTGGRIKCEVCAEAT